MSNVTSDHIVQYALAASHCRRRCRLDIFPFLFALPLCLCAYDCVCLLCKSGYCPMHATEQVLLNSYSSEYLTFLDLPFPVSPQYMCRKRNIIQMNNNNVKKQEK